MKKALKKWLDKLAKANKESFGNERLDCCKLNSEDNQSNMVRNKQNNRQNK